MIVPGLAQPQSSNESPPLPTRGRRRASPAALRRLASSWIAFRLRDLRRRQFAAKAAPLLAVAGLLLALPGLTLLPGPLSFAHGLLIGAVGALLAAVHLGAVADAAATPAPVGDVRFTELCDQLERRIETLQDAHWEISESDVRYRDLLDAQSDVILRRDAEGRLTFVNAAFVGAFGVSAADALGKPFSRVIVEASRTKPLTTADVERSRRYVEQIETASGPRWFEWEEQLVAASDGGLEVQAVGRDITAERRRSDELEEARDAALSANRAKSRFLAAMSHEIRTPMNGILGMSSLLRDTELSDEQRTYVGAVEQSARALLTLIDEILDFSKIEAGKLVLGDAPFEVAAAAQSVIELLAPRAHEKGLELALTVDPALERIVVGDEARVRQIMLNLLSNAVKFTDQGGISVKLTRVPLGNGRIRLSIAAEDSGIGLSAEDMRRLFSEFEQADAAQRRQQGGTGLGLAISKRLALAMGGDIRVASTPGRGSTFTADIVLGVAVSNDDAERAAALVPAAAQCVLLAFDRRIERASLASVLRGAGHSVIEADPADALAAIAEAGRSSMCVTRVIVDVGCDAAVAGGLLAAARAVGAGRQVIGIVTVNVLARAALSTFRDNGFERYLTRPVRAATLLQQVEAAGQMRSSHSGGVQASPAPSPATPPAARRPAAAGGRATVLLVEDNEINALLARRVLERALRDRARHRDVERRRPQVRSRADGHLHAGHGRYRGRGGNPALVCTGSAGGAAGQRCSRPSLSADRRADCQCVSRGSRALRRRRLRRLPRQALRCR